MNDHGAPRGTERTPAPGPERWLRQDAEDILRRVQAATARAPFELERHIEHLNSITAMLIALQRRLESVECGRSPVLLTDASVAGESLREALVLVEAALLRLR